MEGGYVYKYGTGTWKQEGKHIILYSSKTDLKELPITISKYSSTKSGINLIINILPKTEKEFAYLQQTMDLLNIELLIDSVPHALTNETSIIELPKYVKSISFKVYPKKNVEPRTEMLIDTLYSQNIDVSGKENSLVSIDLECNPYSFARVAIEDDTIKIINNHRIKWNKIYLHN